MHCRNRPLHTAQLAAGGGTAGAARSAAMVARAESVVEHVRSGDHNTKLKAVREMKNQVVGSRAKKLQYIKAGAMPHLVAILAADHGDTGLLVQVRLGQPVWTLLGAVAPCAPL